MLHSRCFPGTRFTWNTSKCIFKLHERKNGRSSFTIKFVSKFSLFFKCRGQRERLSISKLTCCSKSMVLMAWRQGRIIMGNPTATDIINPTRIISVTRLDGKFISTFPAMLSVKLTYPKKPTWRGNQTRCLGKRKEGEINMGELVF